jgi:asparagine synthetase B (glutamine-hydrolysing)
MAGICGIISHACKDNSKLASALSRMMAKLGISSRKICINLEADGIFLGTMVSCSGLIDHNHVTNDKLNITCIFEGFVTVAREEKEVIDKSFNLHLVEEKEYLPFLFKLHGEAITEKISGCFNIFIYDSGNKKAMLFNDRLGMLPLYYFVSSGYTVFASRIESLLNSGLIDKIEFDKVTILEHLVFNYPLSDFSFVKNIKTLPNATVIDFHSPELSLKRYWKVKNLFGYDPLKPGSSIPVINEALRNVLINRIKDYHRDFNLSLSGGWDGRLVLSYLIKEYKERVNLYSFGAVHSADITIPMFIAESEGLKHTPVILDDEYLKNWFLTSAINTILSSNGVRSYKRAHYLYAMKLISGISGEVISGNFGDEIFKIAEIKPSEVISSNLVNLIQSRFTLNLMKEINSLKTVLTGEDQNLMKLSDEFHYRLSLLKDEHCAGQNMNESYFSINTTIVARKYFGYEMNSYNDLVNNYSPFHDYCFIKDFSRTRYCSIYHPFNSGDIRKKFASSLLYAKLIRANAESLLQYDSTRNYAIRDLFTTRGKVRILAKSILKYLSKVSDTYNTKPTDDIFTSYMRNLPAKGCFILNDGVEASSSSSVKSLVYWLNHIRQAYAV